MEVGTEDEPYNSKLTITMHGARFDPYIPKFGNKCIGVFNSTLDMHGKVRDVTWTSLAETAYAGSDSRLTKIRDNVTKNIRSFLKNDSDNHKCESLDDFIERKDYPVRVISETAVNALLKQATQAKPEDYNVSPTANQTSLNCMLCPSVTKTNDKGKTDKTRLRQSKTSFLQGTTIIK